MKNIAIIVCLALGGCISSSKFSFARTDNQTNKLRLDGCYFHIAKKIKVTDEVGVYFLFANGVFFHENISYESLDAALKQFEHYKKDNINFQFERTAWGIYKISLDNIILEKPEPIQGYPIHKLIGKVGNDTTFMISSYEERGSSHKTRQDIYFSFKQFNSKPDSTNNFIK